MKSFEWHGYTVHVTKKKVKNANLRMKPGEPSVIHMSIPCRMSFDSALSLLSQPRILRWIERNRQKNTADTDTFRRKKEEREAQAPVCRERLLRLLPALFQKWEQRLGVHCGKVTIRDTRSQWGSCNTRTGNISISLWLGAFPEECIEYVVVHELVHLLEAGHNARFYGFLDQYYPAWRGCREQLKKSL